MQYFFKKDLNFIPKNQLKKALINKSKYAVILPLIFILGISIFSPYNGYTNNAYGVEDTPVTPSAPTINVPSCTSSTYYQAEISWTGDASIWDHFSVEISKSPTFFAYWRKFVIGTSTTAPSGFSAFIGNLPYLTLEPGVTYYARISNGTYGGTTSFTVENSQDCPSSIPSTPSPTPTQIGICELEITKSVDKTTASVGDILTYTLNFKNIGDANCTGSGVEIKDVIYQNLIYFYY